MALTRILLIDDDEDDYILTRELLCDSINNNKYQLSWCNNYQEAINATIKGQYDIFLVDYRLGKYSGIDLLNEAVKSNCKKPILILTGKGDLKIDEEAQRLGAADYLVKDEINSRTLERAIRYALEHHSTLQRLKESENKFRIFFERSKDPIFISDYSGKIYDANTAAIEFFETTKERLLSNNAAQLYKDPVSREDFIGKMEEKGYVNDVETKFLTSKGNVKYGSMTSFLQISQHNAEILYYTILRDLTHQKLQEQQAVLESKFSALESIAKNFALEIYNPLSNINLAVDELNIQLHRQEDLLLTDILKKNCEKIDQLTSELVKSTQNSSIKLKKTNFSQLLKSSIEEAQSLYNLEIVSNLDDQLWLYGDEDKLNFVLQNIFQNSADSISKSDRKILLDVKQKADSILVEIVDNGDGISKENLDKIFEPFFTTKTRASGLGLTHSQRIIQAHNGKLEVTSNVAEGTKVVITLPAEL